MTRSSKAAASTSAPSPSGGNKKKASTQLNSKPRPGSLKSARCLVKTTPQGLTVFSSLPLAGSNIDGELELSEDVSELEVLPVSYSDMASSARAVSLRDVSAAVSNPSHLISHPHSYKRRRDRHRAIAFLDYGSFASFSPSFDSTDAAIGYDEALINYLSCKIIGRVSSSSLPPGSVVEQKVLKEWTGDNSVSANPVQAQESEESSTTEGDSFGPDETAKYLNSIGVDIEGHLRKLRQPMPAAGVADNLRGVNQGLDLLAGLQKDRVDNALLDHVDLSAIYSLAAAERSTSINSLREIKDASRNYSRKKVDSLITPTREELLVHDKTASKLVDLISQAPLSKLVKKSTIESLIKSNYTRTHEINQRGALPTAINNGPLLSNSGSGSQQNLMRQMSSGAMQMSPYGFVPPGVRQPATMSPAMQFHPAAARQMFTQQQQLTPQQQQFLMQAALAQQQQQQQKPMRQ